MHHEPRVQRKRQRRQPEWRWQLRCRIVANQRLQLERVQRVSIFSISPVRMLETALTNQHIVLFYSGAAPCDGNTNLNCGEHPHSSPLTTLQLLSRFPVLIFSFLQQPLMCTTGVARPGSSGPPAALAARATPRNCANWGTTLHPCHVDPQTTRIPDCDSQTTSIPDCDCSHVFIFSSASNFAVCCC